MAGRSWATSIFTAIGAAAGAGAAQLGIGYGLGVISWQPTTGSAPIWVNSLAWVTWLSASSTVFGALLAGHVWQLDADDSPGGGVAVAWRFVIALASAVGALITVPLVALPSRAPRPDNVVPYFTTGGYAIAGVIFGLVVALGVLTARAVTINVLASTAYVWVLAVIAVVVAVRDGKDVAGSAELATWRFSGDQLVRGLIDLPDALLMLLVALVIGAAAAWIPGRRGDNRLGVAISGAAGPLLVAAAYFLAAPGFTDQRLSAVVMAPYAVLAGLAGSVMVAAIGPTGARTEARARRREAVQQRDDQAAAEYSDWTAALSEAERESEADESPTVPVSPAPDRRERHEIEADAYAPARAYTADPDARAYAEDTAEPEPEASPAAAAPATGRATVLEPLWPAAEEPPTTKRKPKS